MTQAEWEGASPERRRLVAGCTRFNIGTPVLDEATGEYVVNHPKFRAEDAVRATEAFNVPEAQVPPLPDEANARPRSELFDVVEARLRPTDAEGTRTADHIQEFLDSLVEGDDVDQRLRGRR
jgi:hypothetical protein